MLRRRVEQLRGPESQADRHQGGRLRLARTALTRVLEPLEPAPLALRVGSRRAPPPYVVASVYRHRNAAWIADLLTGSSGSAALWALDEEHPSLAGETMGSGRGLRFALLNRLLASLTPPAHAWVVLADDDVRLTRGTLDDLVRIAADGAFDLSQPAHDRASFVNWGSTRHALGSTARLTRYVEQGPLVVIGPRARPRVLPLPEDLGMGWGIEAVWAAQRDLRLGIVDAVLARHLHPVSPGGYDVDEQWDQATRLLETIGHLQWSDLQTTLARWPSWRRGRPWALTRGSLDAGPGCGHRPPWK